MIVRLTTGREASMLAAVEHDEEIHAALTRDRRVEGLRIDVNAPFATWLFAREALLDRAFNDRGYRNKGVPSTVGGAVRTITQAIGFVSRHPALRGMGTIGHHAVVFHVWRQSDTSTVYTPYPLPGAEYPGWEFVVLKPTWHSGAGRSKTTTWGPSGVAPADDWLAEEAVHQRLWRESLAKLWHPHLYWLAADEE